jgi:hypothetical protein
MKWPKIYFLKSSSSRFNTQIKQYMFRVPCPRFYWLFNKKNPVLLYSLALALSLYWTVAQVMWSGRVCNYQLTGQIIRESKHIYLGTRREKRNLWLCEVVIVNVIHSFRLPLWYLSIHFRIKDSDYPIGIFKYFLKSSSSRFNTQIKQYMFPPQNNRWWSHVIRKGLQLPINRTDHKGI